MSEQDRVAYNRMKTVIENVQKYLTLSDQRPTELSFDESIRHEYKASLCLTQSFLSGRTTRMDNSSSNRNKTFQSQKAVEGLLRNSLKFSSIHDTKGGL